MSIHVVDTTRGGPATGMRVEVYALGEGRKLLADSGANAKGLAGHPAVAARLTPGPYEILFHVAAYYRSVGDQLPARPFLDVVYYRFGIADPAQHYHMPFKTTPWGYSCFRGA
ncbi:MAG: 5-hydroxyisourate hydrolase [Alphaproteobacteria bacterium]|nr:5-hydroxyisourate hydrolase [Alphaproteobacteria bacterium]